ncbi:MAG TPA: hypothetical protein VG735_01395 [Caulobacterales bacterium]|jgi:hypothetical protein|nr:hypothetical protein [Caulobacterales bacterium]
MKRYRIFVQNHGGGFGGLREVLFADDHEALRAAQLMLGEAEGVDVWDETQRIGLIQRYERERPAA